MRKVSVVGIDNTGKTSIVKSLSCEGVPTIHLTSYDDKTARIARASGKTAHALTEFGERYDLKSLTGLGYLLHLLPYYLEERTIHSRLLVSDRDPIVDTMCYSHVYLPRSLAEKMATMLRYALERPFDYPSAFCYLEVVPETSAARNNKPLQLHDDIVTLGHLRDSFDEEMLHAKHMGIAVLKIDTNAKYLKDITDEVRHWVMTFA